MRPLTFNPGPSQLSLSTEEDIVRGIDQGIYSISHRSAQFQEISTRAINGLRAFMRIPAEYEIFYLPTATDAMESLIKNVVQHSSHHFVNGNFSKVFFEAAKKLGLLPTVDMVAVGQQNNYKAATIPASAEMIAVTYNETSTGVMCQDDDLRALRAANPEKLLAVDITSIAAMKSFEIANADAWFFSVQKGFGLPAGMGILIVSPRAMERARTLQLPNGTFSFDAMAKSMAKNCQTIATPNVFLIYLLMCQVERWNAHGGQAAREAETRGKYQKLASVIESSTRWSFFVQNELHRSISVPCIAGRPEDILSLKKQCKDQGIILGSGYGELKETTFRIGNFPAITVEDTWRLLELL